MGMCSICKRYTNEYYIGIMEKEHTGFQLKMDQLKRRLETKQDEWVIQANATSKDSEEARDLWKQMKVIERENRAMRSNLQLSESALTTARAMTGVHTTSDNRMLTAKYLERIRNSSAGNLEKHDRDLEDATAKIKDFTDEVRPFTESSAAIDVDEDEELPEEDIEMMNKLLGKPKAKKSVRQHTEVIETETQSKPVDSDEADEPVRHKKVPIETARKVDISAFALA